jgi:hypothetical protein
MKPADKDKLNECLDILDTTDLGLSMVWLWTWSTIKNFMDDEEYRFEVSEDEVWDRLCKAVESGAGFSLEYGAEQHHEDVRDWMTDNDIMTDLMFEEDEDEEDEDEDE